MDAEGRGRRSGDVGQCFTVNRRAGKENSCTGTAVSQERLPLPPSLMVRATVIADPTDLSRSEWQGPGEP